MWSIIACSRHLPFYAAGWLDCVDAAATQRVNGKRGLRVAHCSACAALLTSHEYPLITGPCSFINHFNSLGSIQPSSHKFWCTWLITHTSLLGPTGYPLLLLGQDGACVGKGIGPTGYPLLLLGQDGACVGKGIDCPRAQHQQQIHSS